MFDLDQFIADCVAARAEDSAIVAVKEVLDRVFTTPGEIAEALPAIEAELPRSTPRRRSAFSSSSGDRACSFRHTTI